MAEASASFATGVLVNRTPVDCVETVTHHKRLTTVTLRCCHRPEPNALRVKVLGVHVPRAMVHSPDEIDDALRTVLSQLPGRRTITLLASDFNAQLRSVTNSDDCIGRALYRPATPFTSTTDDIVHMLRGAGLTVPMTYDTWWHTTTTDDHRPAHVPPRGSRRKPTGRPPWATPHTFGPTDATTVESQSHRYAPPQLPMDAGLERPSPADLPATELLQDRQDLLGGRFADRTTIATGTMQGRRDLPPELLTDAGQRAHPVPQVLQGSPPGLQTELPTSMPTPTRLRPDLSPGLPTIQGRGTTPHPAFDSRAGEGATQMLQDPSDLQAGLPTSTTTLPRVRPDLPPELPTIPGRDATLHRSIHPRADEAAATATRLPYIPHAAERRTREHSSPPRQAHQADTTPMRRVQDRQDLQPELPTDAGRVRPRAAEHHTTQMLPDRPDLQAELPADARENATHKTNARPRHAQRTPDAMRRTRLDGRANHTPPQLHTTSHTSQHWPLVQVHRHTAPTDAPASNDAPRPQHRQTRHTTHATGHGRLLRHSHTTTTPPANATPATERVRTEPPARGALPPRGVSTEQGYVRMQTTTAPRRHDAHSPHELTHPPSPATTSHRPAGITPQDTRRTPPEECMRPPTDMPDADITSDLDPAATHANESRHAEEDTAANARTTWSGPIYGTRHSRCIDYVACDRRTAPRCSRSSILRFLGKPTDHACASQTFDLYDTAWNITARRSRAHTKPIGWRPQAHEVDEWTTILDLGMRHWTPDWGITELRTLPSRTTHLGHSKAQRMQPTPQSTTEQHLRAQSRTAPTQAGREHVRHALWHEGHHIKREKTTAGWSRVLQHHRHGRWGRRDMLKKTQVMIQLDETGDQGSMTTIRNPMDIANRAHAHYDSLFNPCRCTAENVGEGRMVQSLLSEEHQLWYYDGASITAEDILAAADTCPTNKTCGRDRLTTEQWQTALATHQDLAHHLAWWYNRLLMNASNDIGLTQDRMRPARAAQTPRQYPSETQAPTLPTPGSPRLGSTDMPDARGREQTASTPLLKTTDDRRSGARPIL